MDEVFEREQVVEAPVEALFAYHERQGALERLTPPWQHLEVVERRGTIADRGVVHAKILPGVAWIAQHTDYEPPHLFRDEQTAGPFSKWIHSHHFERIDAGRSKVIDRIEYRLPLGGLGRVVAGRFVRRTLDRMFRYRHTVTALDVQRIAWAAAHGPKRIAVSGASGLLGTALTRMLSLGGHEVLPLVRRGGRGIAWDPERGSIDRAALEGIDAVVHLAGEPIAAKRWTPEFRARALQSRQVGTQLLASTLASLQKPPKVFVSASATGYYGDGGDTWLDETSPNGDGYLAEVCRNWEAATQAAEGKMRVVRTRIGLVMTSQGGPLAELLVPFRLGVGGPFSSGTQFMPWIGIDDLVGAFHHVLFDDTLHGAVNLVAPNPVPNRELSRTLGKVILRPWFATAPAFALQAILGKDKARELLLFGQRVKPTKLQAAGFQFLHRDLEPALRHLLGR